MSSASDYYGGSGIPQTANYAPPPVDFSGIAGALDQFVKGRKEGREEDQAQAFRNGIPRDPSGNFDITKTADIMARKDPSLAMPLINMQMQNQAAQQDAAASAAASAAAHGGAQPQGQPQGQPQAQSQSAAAPSGPTAGSQSLRIPGQTAALSIPPNSPNSIDSLIPDGLSPDQQGVMISKFQNLFKVNDSDAPLSPGQVSIMKRMIAQDSATPQPGGGTPGTAAAAPSDVGMTAIPQGQPPQAALPANFAGRFDAVRPQGVAPAAQPPQQVAQAQQAPQPQQPAVDTDPVNSARLAAAAVKNREADTLQRRQIVAARMNPEAAKGMQKQVDDLREEAKTDIAAVNADVARTGPQKDAELAGYKNPLEADIAKKEMEDEVVRSSKTYSGINAQAKQYGSDMKPLLDITRGILNQPGMYTGMGGDWSLAVNRAKAMLGDVKAAQLQEALSKVTASSVLSQINTQKDQMMEAGSNSGRIFSSQVDQVTKAAPSLGTTVGGNRFLINVADRMGRFQQDVAQQMRNYLNEVDPKTGQKIHGHLDVKFDQKMSDYMEKHPIFGEAETKNPAYLAAPDVPVADIKSKEHLHAWAASMGLKKGDPMRMPLTEGSRIPVYRGAP